MAIETIAETAPENPAAFPSGGPGYRADMTIRDYFAAQALAGLIANPNNKGSEIEVASLSYSIADAMLRERAK